MSHRSAALTAAACLVLASAAAGGAGLGYRGVNTSGIYPASGLMKSWPEGGPELLWKYEVGVGFAGATVVDGRVYIAGGETSHLYVFSLDGRLEARIPVGGAGWKRFSGTRSTILVSDGIAVTTTPDANLYAFDLRSRQRLWKINAWTSFGAGKGDQGWGYPESPLLFGDKVIFNACSRFDETPPIIAVDLRTGKMAWGSDAGHDKKYSAADLSGSLVRHGSRDLVIYSTWRYLVCLDAADGKRLWEIRDVGAKCVTPVYGEGYVMWDRQGQSQMLKLAPDGAACEVLWTRSLIGDRFSHAVILGGRIYGFGNPHDEPQYPRRTTETAPCPPQPRSRKRGNAFLCLDARTGKLLHSIPAETSGHVVAADGMLYAVELLKRKDRPDIVRVSLIRPTAEGFELAGRFMPDLADAELNLPEIEWQASVNPVIADGRLFLRYGPLQVYELRAGRTDEIRRHKQRVASLAGEVASTDRARRMAALAALERMGWQARPAVKALIGLLTDPDAEVRQVAARILGRIGPAAAASLIAALRDERVWADGFAAKALLAAMPEAADLADALARAAEASRAVRDDAEALLPKTGAAAVPGLLRILRTGSRFLRWWAIGVLTRCGPDAREAVPALIDVARTGNQWFQYYAADALGAVGPDAADAVADLLELLKHDYAKTRASAAAALGKIGVAAPNVVAALRKAAKDEDQDVAQAAAGALKRLVSPQGPNNPD